MARDSAPVEVNCKFIHETDEAILVMDAELRQVWVPKLNGATEYDAHGKVLTLPEWLATERGLI